MTTNTSVVKPACTPPNHCTRVVYRCKMAVLASRLSAAGMYLVVMHHATVMIMSTANRVRHMDARVPRYMHAHFTEVLRC